MISRTRTLPPEPGIYPGVPFDDYIRWSALSQSDLKSARTMAHLKHRLEAVPAAPGPAQCKGTAFHTLLLEPEAFGDRIAICPINERSGESWGRGTLKWNEWAETVPGKTHISEAESREIERMAIVAREHPTIKMLSEAKGETELSIVWKDPEFGCLCKGRIDRLIVTPKVVTFADIKTCENAAPEKFARDCDNYGYDAQAWWYARGLGALLPYRELRPWIVAIEDDDGYIDVAAYSVGPDELRVGGTKLRYKLAQYAAAKKSNKWPGYEHESPLVLPAYAYKRAELEGEIK